MDDIEVFLDNGSGLLLEPGAALEGVVLTPSCLTEALVSVMVGVVCKTGGGLVGIGKTFFGGGGGGGLLLEAVTSSTKALVVPSALVFVSPSVFVPLYVGDFPSLGL